MKHLLTAPFHAIDSALAERLCQWLKTDDAILRQSIAATSFALQQGHSCLSLEQCLTEAPYNNMSESGGSEFPSVSEWRTHLAQFNLSADSNSPVIFENDRLYLRRYWQFEHEIASMVAIRTKTQLTPNKAQLSLAKKLLTEYFPAHAEQTDWQKVAAMNSLFNSFNVIIGGPGTGKTYTVTRILALLANLAEHPPIIKLAAPTGKAAQRLAESIRDAKQQMNLDMLVAEAIPDQASTLHRLLGVIPNQLQFRHNAENPIEADILLIDEVSMVDLPLMTRLLRATKADTRIILLGDADQLPSVAAGSILADLVTMPDAGYSQQRCLNLKQLDSQVAFTASENAQDYVTELKHSRRFADGSGIGQLAKQVIQGNAQQSLKLFNQYEDINWLNDAEFEQHINHWINQYFRPIGFAKTLADAFIALKAFRILCATREGERGVEYINQRISTRFNPNQQPYYQGQPIMVNQNHYGVRLFNGDIGLVWPNAQGNLMAWFEVEGGVREVALGRLPSVETVYAMTIHKTQGSEFTHVALLLPETHNQGLCRELIYTGLTRAKQSFCCLGNSNIWQAGVIAQVSRWSGLADKI